MLVLSLSLSLCRFTFSLHQLFVCVTFLSPLDPDKSGGALAASSTVAAFDWTPQHKELQVTGVDVNAVFFNIV